MKGFKTVQQAAAANQINKSPAWIRAGIKVGKIRAEKVNSRLILISDDEIQRIKDNPIVISKEEMFG